jgi:hypothetical protein
LEKIRAKVRSLDEVRGKGLGKEVPKFISHLKMTSTYHINPDDKPKLNRLCYVEDWENGEIKETISSLLPAFSRGYCKKSLGMGTCNKLQKLQLVEPLDLRITTKTLDSAMGLYDTIDKTHPHILVRYGDMLLLLCLFFKNNE